MSEVVNRQYEAREVELVTVGPGGKVRKRTTTILVPAPPTESRPTDEVVRRERRDG